MLALTEPNDIHALAVIEPMVDWVGLDEVMEQLRAAASLSSATQRRQKKGSFNRYGVDTLSVMAATEQLIKLRSKLFHSPSAYFDPFASPMLFLRAPGQDTPTGTIGDRLVSEMVLADHGGGYGDGDYDSEPDSYGPYDDDWSQSSPSTVTSSATQGETIGEASSDEATPEIQPRRRKVLRRWPAVGLPESVTLPRVRVFVQAQSQAGSDTWTAEETRTLDMANGHAALMRAQGAEMTELMRRACFIGREKSFAEERVQLSECKQGVADEGAEDLQQSAIKWVGQMFMRD